MRIAVIGGSISGCMSAALLARAGHQVSVYERSASNLVGRGGGIATSTKVIASLKQAGLVGEDFPTVPHHWLRLAVRTQDESRVGRSPWAPALAMECVHWSGLFAELKRNLGDVRYLLGKELQNVRHEGDLPCLQFADGTSEVVDLVVFTDGFRSRGRELMFPEVTLDYRDMVIWRGTLDEGLYAAGDALEEHPRLSFQSMPGSFITYLMPSHTGSTQAGERVINWAAYLPVSREELPAMMVDKEGRQREGTVPAGFFPLERERQLKQMMHEQLPSVFADIIEASVDTQFQPLRTAVVPSHYSRRMCLVGDAAVAIQPLTGAGAFKAFENASGLVQALQQDDDLDASLQAWSDSQLQMEQRLMATGLAMEKAFLWNTINLAEASAAEVEHWWQDAIGSPPDYTYLKVS